MTSFTRGKTFRFFDHLKLNSNLQLPIEMAPMMKLSCYLEDASPRALPLVAFMLQHRRKIRNIGIFHKQAFDFLYKTSIHFYKFLYISYAKTGLSMRKIPSTSLFEKILPTVRLASNATVSVILLGRVLRTSLNRIAFGDDGHSSTCSSPWSMMVRTWSSARK